ncbi:MAG: endonuclease/exonuclease/phosphatase family protein [Candidatus Krumholzibacteriia bacterium]
MRARPEVRWIEPPAASERRNLRAWRDAVGPPVCIWRGSAGPHEVDSLAIISWNVHVGGGDLVRFVEGLRAGRFTDGRPPRHFVLLLQEVHRRGIQTPAKSTHVETPRRIENSPPTGDRLDIVQVAEKLHLTLYYVPSMRNGPPGKGTTEEDRGNAILSTLPLSDPTAIELPYELQRRVAVAASVRGRTSRGGLWQLRVCSAHLDGRSRWSRVFASFGAGRLRQARALVQSLPEMPAVLGGDFNTWSFSCMETAISYIRKNFSGSSRMHTEPTMPTPFSPDRRLDYLFFKLPEGCSAHYRRLGDRLGSDHYPLLGWVRFD